MRLYYPTDEALPLNPAESSTQAAARERSHRVLKERVSGRDDPPDFRSGQAVAGGRIYLSAAPQPELGSQDDPNRIRLAGLEPQHGGFLRCDALHFVGSQDLPAR